jgi:hypothetical protein
MMPASLKMATLLPDWAMRVRRVALPFREVVKVEKVSLWDGASVWVEVRLEWEVRVLR